MKNRGYTLLISVIVSSIVLSIAVFVVTAARKQAILSSVASDSTLAIYAADSAIQCAVEAFGKGDIAVDAPSPKISCGTVEAGSIQTDNFVYTKNNSGGNIGIYTTPNNISLTTNDTSGKPFYISPYNDTIISFKFSATPGSDDGTCATVVIIDGYDNNGKHMTVIDARGYNMITSSPCSNSSTYNPRLVERLIRLTLY